MGPREGVPDNMQSGPFRRPSETVWLYDPVAEEFHPAPVSPEVGFSEPERRFEVPGSRRVAPPSSRARRSVRWLFKEGGMSLVFLAALMALGLLCGLLGIR